MAKTVEIKRNGATAADDPACFNRLHWALEPAARAAPGDDIVFEPRARRPATTSSSRRATRSTTSSTGAPRPPRSPPAT
jgi:hypothetical protein